MGHEKIIEVLQKLKIKVPSDETINLFDHGVDSLKLVQLVMALEKAFTVKLISRDFNRNSFESIQKISEHITNLQKGSKA